MPSCFTSSIRVFVVAHSMLCWGFEKLVHTASRAIRVTGTASTLDEAMPRLEAAWAEVVVVDLDEGLAEDQLAQAAQACPVLLLSSARDDRDAEKWRAAGVTAVVGKHDPPELLLSALEQACERARSEGRAPTAAHVEAAAAAAPEEARISALTARERQLIFALMCHFTEPGKVVASRLRISEHTLRNHLSAIYAKLGVRNRLSLHGFAMRHHLDCRQD